MKKKGLAVLIAAVTLGTTVGSTALYYGKDEARLQLSGGQSIEDVLGQEEEEDSGSEKVQEKAEDTETVISAETADLSESGSMAEQVAAELPTGIVQRADLTGMTKEEALMSGVADVAENVMPAIVSITMTSVQNVEDWFRGRLYQMEQKGAGTGVIMGANDDELLIVTNNHVVEGATELTVSFVDEESCSAEIKGTDSKNDLAVVAVKLDDIDKDTLDVIRVANVADSDGIRVGQQIVAIGNALGFGQSVTTGIVSALNREISVRDGYAVQTFDGLIQTDAAINSGNSGGAMLNMRGEVIGINCARAGLESAEDMGYAIPTSKALPIIQKLMNRETRTKVEADDASYIGISGQEVTSEVVELYGLPAGIYITSVGPDTPAAEAGLEEGMILTALDDYEITSMSDLQGVLEYYSGGETVTLTVCEQSRQGGYEEKQLEITLGYKSDYMSYVR